MGIFAFKRNADMGGLNMLSMQRFLLRVLLWQFIVVQVLGAQLKEAGHITLSMKKDPLYMGETFAVTEDDLFIVSDYKDGNFKIYNDQGEYVMTWGKQGLGPNEFLSPRYCYYQKPYFIFYDMGRMRIYVYKRVGKTEFMKETEFIQTPDQMDFCLIKDDLIIASHIGVSDIESYAVYKKNIKDGKPAYFLENYKKYGFSSQTDLLANSEVLGSFGQDGYCDSYGKYVYFAWGGNLKVFRIGLYNKKISFFDSSPGNYRKPRMNKNIKDAYRTLVEGNFKLGRVRIAAEKQKFSFVTGLFADSAYLGVVYENFDKNRSLWQASLCLFSLEGKILLDCLLPGAVRTGNLRNKNIQYDKVKKCLYYLSITSDESTGYEKYDIYKYVII